MCYNVCMEQIDIYLKSYVHKVILQDIKSEMLNHCYLINSKDEYLVKFVAKEIFCESEKSPCEQCVSCNKVNHDNMVDLITYPKGDKSLVVDDINEIVDDCYIRPMDAKYKVYILNRFDECTVQAQNKILKTLEEPPQNVVFILTCTNIGNVLPTIASRSKKINEPELPYEIVEKFLEQKNVSNYKLIASMSDGCLSIANRLAGNPLSVEIVKLAFDVLKNLNSSQDVLKFSSKIIALKKDFIFFLDTIVTILRDICVFSSNGEVVFKENKSDYEVLSKIYNSKMIVKIVDELSNIPNKLNFNCNMTAIVDQMLLDILEVKFLWRE